MARRCGISRHSKKVERGVVSSGVPKVHQEVICSTSSSHPGSGSCPHSLVDSSLHHPATHVSHRCDDVRNAWYLPRRVRRYPREHDHERHVLLTPRGHQPRGRQEVHLSHEALTNASGGHHSITVHRGLERHRPVTRTTRTNLRDERRGYTDGTQGGKKDKILLTLVYCNVLCQANRFGGAFLGRRKSQQLSTIARPRTSAMNIETPLASVSAMGR